MVSQRRWARAGRLLGCRDSKSSFSLDLLALYKIVILIPRSPKGRDLLFARAIANIARVPLQSAPSDQAQIQASSGPAVSDSSQPNVIPVTIKCDPRHRHPTQPRAKMSTGQRARTCAPSLRRPLPVFPPKFRSARRKLSLYL